MFAMVKAQSADQQHPAMADSGDLSHASIGVLFVYKLDPENDHFGSTDNQR
jgi:hypothetical protein